MSAVEQTDLSFLVRGGVLRGSEEVVSPGWEAATLTGSTFVGNEVVVAASRGFRQVQGSTFVGNGSAVAALDARGNPREGPVEVVGSAFRRNGDAIVAEPGADIRLGDNVVTGSSGWGIHAPGAVDLGGNRAWGNAREPQCTGVVCRRS